MNLFQISIGVFQANFADAKVSEASDLDCNFEFSCNWFNGTSGLEDNDDWKTAQAVTLGTWNHLPMLSLTKDGGKLTFNYSTVALNSLFDFLYSDFVYKQIINSCKLISAGSCLEDQQKHSRASKLAFSADCTEANSLTFMATTKTESKFCTFIRN